MTSGDSQCRWPPSTETASVQTRFLQQLNGLIDGEEWTPKAYGVLPLREGFLAFPDIVVLMGGDRLNRDAWPQAIYNALVVEVSDHLYRRSKAFKLAEYAGAGVPETWVVAVINRRVSGHRQGRYDRPQEYPEGESIALPLGDPSRPGSRSRSYSEPPIVPEGRPREPFHEPARRGPADHPRSGGPAPRPGTRAASMTAGVGLRDLVMKARILSTRESDPPAARRD